MEQHAGTGVRGGEHGRAEQPRADVRHAGRDQQDRPAEYHSAHQPPALVLWDLHDAYFDVDRCSRSIARWTRMDAHLFDGGHLLLETHAAECAALLRAFVRDHS
ncbi:hypothetical protein [Micromonospora chalcea]|uniref:hypothetical protein n=1 Tax=Micromonospora chalcea TaxID=1874 RepID=UPI0037CC2CEA